VAQKFRKTTLPRSSPSRTVPPAGVGSSAAAIRRARDGLIRSSALIGSSRARAGVSPHGTAPRVRRSAIAATSARRRARCPASAAQPDRGRPGRGPPGRRRMRRRVTAAVYAAVGARTSPPCHGRRAPVWYGAAA
jgi:hypothetical protein